MAEEADEDTPKPIFHPGPWHIVQAMLEKDETWAVNRIVRRISDGDCVAFMLTDEAMHFVQYGRARDLGVWDTIEEFNAAWAAAQQPEPEPEAAPEPAKKPNRKQRRQAAHGQEGYQNQARE